MCVHKYDNFIEKSILSVLSQSDIDFLFYIIVNGDDDFLWDYLCSIKDSRVKLYRTKITQLCFNLNYGVNLIKSDYILRMDADDICTLDRLEKTKNHLEKLDFPDVFSASYFLIDEDGNNIGESIESYSVDDIRSLLWKRNPICHPTVAIKRNVLIGNGGYSWGFNSEDYDLWIRLFRSDDVTAVRVKDILISYRLSSAQSRGKLLPYSEVAGLMLREFLLMRKVKYFLGFLLAILKAIFRNEG